MPSEGIGSRSAVKCGSPRRHTCCTLIVRVTAQIVETDGAIRRLSRIKNASWDGRNVEQLKSLERTMQDDMYTIDFSNISLKNLREGEEKMHLSENMSSRQASGVFKPTTRSVTSVLAVSEGAGR